LDWLTERFKDGTLRITWTTRRNAREALYLNEAGFYPEEVPAQSFTVIDKQGLSSAPLRPVTIVMTGNAAHLPKKDRISYSREFPATQDPRRVAR
jgi:hypothetical protein